MIHSVENRASGVARTSHIIHIYESAPSTNFVLPSHEHYQAGLASIAHSRSLEFLKKYLGGPNFDLEAIWDEHTLYEFEEQNVEKTMGTMVEEPYVNHVPTVCSLPSQASLTGDYLLQPTETCHADDGRCWPSRSNSLLRRPLHIQQPTRHET
jgi:hypothetical protein